MKPYLFKYFLPILIFVFDSCDIFLYNLWAVGSLVFQYIRVNLYLYFFPGL